MGANQDTPETVEPRLARLEVALQNALYRIVCPSPDRLRQFYWQQLVPDEAADIVLHCGECPLCARELAEIRQVVDADRPVLTRQVGSPMETIQQRTVRVLDAVSTASSEAIGQIEQSVRLLIARFVEVGQPQLAYARLRGPGAKTLLYACDDGMVSVLFQPQPDGMTYLNGQMLPEEVAPLYTSFVLAGRDGEQPAHTGKIDAFGAFVAGPLSPGEYQLVLRATGTQVIISSLTVD